MKQVVKAYAEALFQLGMELEQLDTFYRDAKTIRTSLDASMDRFFKCHRIDLKDKKEVLRKAFDTHVHSYLLNFMYVLLDYKRFEMMDEILKAFNTLANQHYKIKEGIVYSAFALDEDQIKEIEEALALKYHHKVELENVVDKKLISGIKVELDHVVYDASMRKSIDNLKVKLLNERWVK
ncbi:MAG: ATP synthase F1 subunit delta [Erysipelotrichaceae bacterium]|nr:ATP synthase F1 subunit delta [Erysipelotrichaceae bacterium]MDO5085119.1 ATP synthase F1 subunit delta [Erysipelotrichaceae bacterium]